jgi:enterochelin esterase-like enzyme
VSEADSALHPTSIHYNLGTRTQSDFLVAGMNVAETRGLPMLRLLCVEFLIGLMACVTTATAQAPAAAPSPVRPTPPTRNPHTPGYVAARELPDGANPPANVDGNFILGPTHTRAPEMETPEDTRQNVPKGVVIEFTMKSTDSKIYPGIARAGNTFGTADPANPAKLIVTTSHPAPYTRNVAVYVPKQYVPGSAAPFIVGADGPDPALFTALDHLIAQHRVPAMIAISIGNGSGDAQGSERGLEYDTMSSRYAEFVESEVLPVVEQKAHVKLTADPDGRATMGGSSGGSCALIMAWYHPELYHRVLTYSGTYVNQQWPYSPQTPHGAWEFHEHLIPDSPAKPLRIWMEVGDRDLLNPNIMRDNMHDWVVANEQMAKVLAAKGYHYQFVFAINAGHTDRTVKQQTLPEALEYLWQGYPAAAKN